MSRYDIQHGDKVFSYGYDRPLNEYFAMLCHTDAALDILEQEKADRLGLDPDEVHVDPEVFWIGTKMTVKALPDDPANMRYSHLRIAEVMEEYGAPEEHVNAVRGFVRF